MTALRRFRSLLAYALNRILNPPPVLDPTWQRFNQALNHPDPDADTAPDFDAAHKRWLEDGIR